MTKWQGICTIHPHTVQKVGAGVWWALDVTELFTSGCSPALQAAAGLEAGGALWVLSGDAVWVRPCGSVLPRRVPGREQPARGGTYAPEMARRKAHEEEEGWIWCSLNLSGMLVMNLSENDWLLVDEISFWEKMTWFSGSFSMVVKATFFIYSRCFWRRFLWFVNIQEYNVPRDPILKSSLLQLQQTFKGLPFSFFI